METQMDILKTAMEWAKAETFSSAFFAVFGLVFLVASLSFWHFGKTETAKAYIIPFLVVGGLLIILGAGLVMSTQWRMAGFPDAFNADAASFITAEIARVDKTMNGYNNAITRGIPVIILVCAAILLVMKTPIWQAGAIAAIAMMAVILVIDTNATARLADYKERLVEAGRP